MREQVIRRVKYVLARSPIAPPPSLPRLLSPHFISIQLRCGIFGDANELNILSSLMDLGLEGGPKLRETCLKGQKKSECGIQAN